MTARHVVGIDLSGPTNARDTAVATARDDGDRLRCTGIELGLDDSGLRDAIESWGDHCVVGLDAPLSYQPGGGDRHADRSLRRAVKPMLPAGSVMTPTMTRMAYLTLRGMAVARLVQSLRPDARIVEVHPGASLVLAGADDADVRALKADADARERLRRWLGENGVGSIPTRPLGDHELAAVAAARAAWRWSHGHAAWRAPADFPLHPFDVCA
jgi:predicted nuclease with RNAse H fold